MKTLVFRGTPVTCARDVADLLDAAGQDLDLSKVRIGSDMLVNRAVHEALRANWLRLAPHAVPGGEVRLVGHSLGACHALAAAAFLPRPSVTPHVFAFAPFQCANGKFWGAAYAGRPTPRCYGRSGDFAPGWDHLDPATELAGPITELLGDGKTSVRTSWPLGYESVADHGVDRYVADLGEVPGEGEAYLACRLASAVYLTEAGDVVERFSAMGFRTLDVVEAPGFRCVVCEEGEGR